MIKNFFTGLALMLLAVSTNAAKQVKIEIRNSSTEPRSELVEMDAALVLKKLGTDKSPIVIKDSKGREVATQLTHDGKLLIDVTVESGSTLTLTAVKGTPQTVKPSVFGRQYPQRKDDFAWENDKCIFRMYGPALQQSGEKAYGIDVWVKNTPELVVDQRYTSNFEGQERIRQLRQEGGHETEIKQIERSINYHIDHGNGNDPYKVGPTLGCGAPALMEGGKLSFPWGYKDYQVLDNGPLRLTVQFDYPNRKAASENNIVEHRLLTVDKGSRFCRMTVWYDGLSHKHQLTPGVVIHAEDSTSYQLGKDYVLYADPTDNVKRNKHTKVFVAVLFPQGVSQTCYLPGKAKGGATGHALGVVDNYQGEPYTYWFGSAWSGWEVKTQEQWQLCVEQQLKTLEVPLSISVK